MVSFRRIGEEAKPHLGGTMPSLEARIPCRPLGTFDEFKAIQTQLRSADSTLWVLKRDAEYRA